MSPGATGCSHARLAAWPTSRGADAAGERIIEPLAPRGPSAAPARRRNRHPPGGFATWSREGQWQLAPSPADAAALLQPVQDPVLDAQQVQLKALADRGAVRNLDAAPTLWPRYQPAAPCRPRLKHPAGWRGSRQAQTLRANLPSICDCPDRRRAWAGTVHMLDRRSWTTLSSFDMAATVRTSPAPPC